MTDLDQYANAAALASASTVNRGLWKGKQCPGPFTSDRPFRLVSQLASFGLIADILMHPYPAISNIGNTSDLYDTTTGFTTTA